MAERLIVSFLHPADGFNREGRAVSSPPVNLDIESVITQSLQLIAAIQHPLPPGFVVQIP